MVRKTSVFIVDDHNMMIQGLSLRLEKEPDIQVIGSAQSVPEAISKLEEHQPDIAIIDLSLEDQNGLDLIKTLKSSYPNIHTIAVTMYEERVYAERCIRAGAKGFVQKSQTFDVVIEAIRHVADGGVFF